MSVVWIIILTLFILFAIACIAIYFLARHNSRLKEEVSELEEKCNNLKLEKDNAESRYELKLKETYQKDEKKDKTDALLNTGNDRADFDSSLGVLQDASGRKKSSRSKK
jgi:hypothetical protein